MAKVLKTVAAYSDETYYDVKCKVLTGIWTTLSTKYEGKTIVVGTLFPSAGSGVFSITIQTESPKSEVWLAACKLFGIKDPNKGFYVEAKTRGDRSSIEEAEALHTYYVEQIKKFMP